MPARPGTRSCIGSGARKAGFVPDERANSSAMTYATLFMFGGADGPGTTNTGLTHLPRTRAASGRSSGEMKPTPTLYVERANGASQSNEKRYRPFSGASKIAAPIARLSRWNSSPVCLLCWVGWSIGCFGQLLAACGEKTPLL